MQQWLFSNLISISLSGKLGSNGVIYVMPLPMIVCLGVNYVSETTPVFPGSMHILFLSMGLKSVGGITCVMHNLAMQTVVP